MIYAQQAPATLHADDTPLLTSMSDAVSLEEDPTGTAIFLRTEAPEAASRHQFVIGHLEGVDRFTCCHRSDPFWMVPAAGASLASLPEETQFLMARLTSGKVVILLPLIDGWWRCSLAADAEGMLLLNCETGDTDTVGLRLTGLLVACGDDPYSLMPVVAKSAAARMQTGRLRREKPLPPLADLFGWCTWDAFYQQVSHDKVIAGLQSFTDGGVRPTALILDDGWHTVTEPSGDGLKRLASFSANERFPGDLAPTVAAAKHRFGIRQFYVWHAMVGYWGGVDPQAMPEYQVREVKRRFSDSLKRVWALQDASWWEQQIGMVHPESIGHFFNDFHRHLREQGVDGVKVDSQTELEGLGEGLGGRVEVMRAYHEALEGSAHTHFLGNLINCMSCSNDVIFSALNSNLTRSSTDFWPKRPESHGLHLYTNAQTSFWMGEFVHPDWDMFQSAHQMGAFHAAGRAVSGSPVYVSDKPEEHDFKVLRKLVLSDGTTLRAKYPGRPTPDCLFHDPRSEDIALKIFNLNAYGGVVGVFNSRWAEGAATQPRVAGSVSPADIPDLAGDRFAIYAHQGGTLSCCDRTEGVQFDLEQGDFEIYTIMPIVDDFAPIGLADKYNSAGAVRLTNRHGEVIIVELRDGGDFIAWCRQRPKRLFFRDIDIDFTWDSQTHALTAAIPLGGGVLSIE